MLWHWEAILIERQTRAGGLLMLPATLGPKARFKQI